MSCHQLLCLSDLKSWSVKEAGGHCCGKCDESARTLHVLQLMGHTHPVIQCKYNAQCIRYYMICHVCLAWHIVTNCGCAPQRHLRSPAAGKRSDGRVLFQDSITPSFVDMLGISAGVPQLRCLGQSQY